LHIYISALTQTTCARRWSAGGAVAGAAGAAVSWGNSGILLSGGAGGGGTTSPDFAGGAIIRGLKSRENINLYRKQSFGKVDDVETIEYGFYTSKDTREDLLDELRRRIKANDRGDETLIIPFSEFWDEGNTFIIDKSGKPIHQLSAHDDTIFAGAITLETAIQANEMYPIEKEETPRQKAFDASPLHSEEELSNIIYAGR